MLFSTAAALDCQDVLFFTQGDFPMSDKHGKFLMSEKHRTPGEAPPDGLAGTYIFSTPK